MQIDLKRDHHPFIVKAKGVLFCACMHFEVNKYSVCIESEIVAEEIDDFNHTSKQRFTVLYIHACEYSRWINYALNVCLMDTSI
jgi:hypothetical protein